MICTICLKFTETGKLTYKTVKNCDTFFVVIGQHNMEAVKDMDLKCERQVSRKTKGERLPKAVYGG